MSDYLFDVNICRSQWQKTISLDIQGIYKKQDQRSARRGYMTFDNKTGIFWVSILRPRWWLEFSWLDLSESQCLYQDWDYDFLNAVTVNNNNNTSLKDPQMSIYWLHLNNIHFAGCLYFLGRLHFWGRLNFWGRLLFWGCLHFWVVFIF